MPSLFLEWLFLCEGVPLGVEHLEVSPLEPSSIDPEAIPAPDLEGRVEEVVVRDQEISDVLPVLEVHQLNPVHHLNFPSRHLTVLVDSLGHGLGVETDR